MSLNGGEPTACTRAIYRIQMPMQFDTLPIAMINYLRCCSCSDVQIVVVTWKRINSCVEAHQHSIRFLLPSTAPQNINEHGLTFSTKWKPRICAATAKGSSLDSGLISRCAARMKSSIANSWKLKRVMKKRYLHRSWSIKLFLLKSILVSISSWSNFP